jgi:hypothetical protein
VRFLEAVLRLELERLEDPLLRLRAAPADFRLVLLEPFASPACRRCLLTVAAAISFARFVLRPLFFADSLMCSY